MTKINRRVAEDIVSIYAPPNYPDMYRALVRAIELELNRRDVNCRATKDF